MSGCRGLSGARANLFILLGICSYQVRITLEDTARWRTPECVPPMRIFATYKRGTLPQVTPYAINQPR